MNQSITVFFLFWHTSTKPPASDTKDEKMFLGRRPHFPSGQDGQALEQIYCFLSVFCDLPISWVNSI